MAKKKINDDKLLQLIRDGNSRHQLQPPCQYEKSDEAGVGNEKDNNMLIRVPAPSNVPNPFPQSLNSPSFCRFWSPFLLPLLDAASECRFAGPNHPAV
jgi:hypothetical protein